MSYCKIKKADEEEGGLGACDLNGNFFLPEDPKNCVLQILSDTLGGNPLPGSALAFDQTPVVVDPAECRTFPSSRTHLSSSLLNRNQPSAHLILDEDEDDNENQFEIDNDFEREDVLAIPVVRCGSGNCKNSESSVSFNPGDTLSSPVPPLARLQTSRSVSRTHIGSKTNIYKNTALLPAPSSALNLNSERRTVSGSRLENNNSLQQQIPTPSHQFKLQSTQPPSPSLRHQFKQCHLSTVLGSARRCIRQLLFVKDGLASIVSADDQLSQGKKAPKTQNQHERTTTTTTSKDYALIATLGEYILNLTRSAFTPAHRLYTSALGLHMAEDLIRNPNDPTLLNFKKGHIIRPSWNSIIHTQMKLRFCVDAATEAYHRFGRDANSSSSSSVSSTTLDFSGNGSGSSKSPAVRTEQMMQVMVTLMHAFQDLYATALGSNDIFKVLLHIEDYGEEILQEFLLSLESMERSELLVQVQALRRSFDDIVISMEQLSWAAYVVYRLASGKSLTPSPDDSMPASEQTSNTSIPNSDTTIPGGKSHPRRSSSSSYSSSSARNGAGVKGHDHQSRSTNSTSHKSSSGKEKSSTEINPKKSSTSSVNLGGRRISTSSHSNQNQHETNNRGSSSSSKSGGKGQTPSSISSYSNSHLNSKDGKHGNNENHHHHHSSVSSRVSETRTIAGKSRRNPEDSNKDSRSRSRDKEKEKERDRSKESHRHRSHDSTASRIPTPKNGSSSGSSKSKKGSSPTPSSSNSYSSTLSSHVKGHDSRKSTGGSSSSSNSGYKNRGEKERISKTELKSKSSSSTSQKHGKSISRSNSREGRDRDGEKDKVNTKGHSGHSGHRPSSSSSKTSHHSSSVAPSSSRSSNYVKSGKEKDGKEREKEKDRERHHQHHSSSRSSSSKQRPKLIVSDHPPR